MKVKNIAFSGIMAAILMGASGANAAVEIASKQYVLNQVGDKATTAALESAQSTLQGAIDLKADQTALDATNEEVAKKANAADVYTITQADQKFQTIAKAAEDATAATNYTNEKVQELANTLGGTGEDGQATGLVSTVTAQGNRISGLETLVGDKSVADQIATSLTDYAKTSYVDSQDAATLNSAKTYTDDEIAKLSADGGAIKTLETTVAGHTTSIQSLQNDKADASTVTTLSGKVDTLTGTVEGWTNDETGIAATYATKTDLKATDDKAVANAEAIADIEASDYATSGIDAEKVAQIETNKNAITTLNADAQTAGSVDNKVSALLGGVPVSNTCDAQSGLCVLTKGADGSLVWIDVTNPADAPL